MERLASAKRRAAARISGVAEPPATPVSSPINTPPPAVPDDPMERLRVARDRARRRASGDES